MTAILRHYENCAAIERKKEQREADYWNTVGRAKGTIMNDEQRQAMREEREYLEANGPGSRSPELIEAENRWLAKHHRHPREVERITPPAHRPEIVSVLGCKSCGDFFSFVELTPAEKFLAEHGQHQGRVVEVRVVDGKSSRRMKCNACGVEIHT